MYPIQSAVLLNGTCLFVYRPADMYNTNNDPEELIECPYNKSHMIRAKRMPYHLMKCRQVGYRHVSSHLTRCQQVGYRHVSSCLTRCQQVGYRHVSSC